MSFELINELKANMPEASTPTQRLVLLLIAEHARTESRVWIGGKDLRPFGELQRLTGLTTSGLGKALRDLSRMTAPSGELLELRIEVAQDSRGRSVYSYEGRCMSFRLPPLAPPDSLIPASAITGGRPLDMPQWSHSTAPSENGEAALQSLSAPTPGRPPTPERSPSTATHSVKPSEEPSSARDVDHRSAVVALLQKHGHALTELEAEAAVAAIAARPEPPRHLTPYVLRMPLADVVRHGRSGPARVKTRATCKDPECRDGWRGEDERGRPVPCLDCRPHLAASEAAS